MLKKLISTLLSFIMLFTLAVPAFAAQNSTVTDKEDQYIIKFKDVSKGKTELQKNKRKADKQFTRLPSHAALKLKASEVQQLRKDANVEYIEKDYAVHQTVEQATYKDQISYNLLQIHAPEAQEQGATGDKVKIAILDTGISSSSTELHIAGGVSFVPAEPTYEDQNGHGTAMAGIAAAIKDNKGLLGVAPGAEIYAVKVLDRQGSGTYSQVIQGIEWAIDNHMDIVSMSFAGIEYSKALEEAAQLAYQNGILLVAATGNDGAATVSYPAKYSSVIAVGAVDEHNQLASFSNTGEEVELVAPGVNIQGLSLTTYSTLSGTSAAVPHVAGAAALVKQQHPEYKNVQLRQVLNQSATPLGNKNQFGNGLVNALGSVRYSAVEGTEPTPEPPSKNDKSTLGNFTEEEVNTIQSTFSSDMLLLAAYVYPTLSPLLSQEQAGVLAGWTDAQAEQTWTQLNGSQQALIKKWTPVVAQRWDPASKPKDDPVENTAAKQVQAAEDNYDIIYRDPVDPTPYMANIDGAIDTIHRTSAQQETDLYLPGKHGLDFSIVRTYNSLAAKVTSLSNCGFYSKDCYVVSVPSVYYPGSDEGYDFNATAQPDNFKKGVRLNEIATGWSINLPTMSKTVDYRNTSTSGKITLNTTPNGYNYYRLQPVYELHFTLEDGKTYSFRIGETTPYNWPYSNVKLTDARSDYYILTVNDDVQYYFMWNRGNMYDRTKRSGLYMKKNRYGDAIYYSQDGIHVNSKTGFAEGTLQITDTMGRQISVPLDSSGISGFTVTDAGGNETHRISYNRSKKVQQEGEEYYGETYFYKLDSVTDQHNGQKVLRTYKYKDPEQWRADANIQDDYRYDVDNSGKPVLDLTVNGQGVDSSWIHNKDMQYSKDIKYLLLESVTDDIGFITTYEYQPYDSSWRSYPSYEERMRKRGTIRNYMDPYALTYYGYHPVVNVKFSYTDSTGAAKNLTRTFSSNSAVSAEIWSEPKTNNPYGNFHLTYSGSYRSGDRPATTVKTYYGDYTEELTTQYAANGLGSTVPVNQLKKSSPSTVNWENGNQRYTWSDIEVTSYRYDVNKPNPKSIIRWVDGGAADTKPQNILDFLRYGLYNNLPAGLSNYATVSKKDYDNYGYVTYEEDSYGNKVTRQYIADPDHRLSYLKQTSADGLVQYEESYAYTSRTGAISYFVTEYDNDGWPYLAEYHYPLYTLDKVTTKDTYPDANTGQAVSDTVVTEYLLFDTAKKVPTQIKEASSGSQFNDAIVTTRNLEYDGGGLHITRETIGATLAAGQGPTNLVISREYDAYDRVKKITYPDNNSVTYGYDFKNRLTQSIFAPAANPAATRTTQFAYDDASRTITKTLPDGEKGIITYSPYGKVEKQQRQVGGSTILTLRNVMDSTGVLLKETQPYGDASKKTTYVYGGSGDIQTATNALGQQTNYYYGNTATSLNNATQFPQSTVRVVEPDGKETWTIKDREGRTLQVVEKSLTKNRETRYTYTPLGKLSQQQILNGQGAAQTTQYKYDGLGNMTYLKDDKGQVFQYTYNRFGNMVKTIMGGTQQKLNTYNELGWLLSKTLFTNPAEQYQYNKNGLVSRYTDKAGQAYTYTYTDYNEESRISIVNPAGAEVYWKQNTYDGLTRLLTAISSSEGETLEYHYDNLKRMDWQKAAGRTYSLGYDGFDRLKTLTYPDGQQITYGYDNLNRINSVAYPGMGTVVPSYGVTNNENKYALTMANGLKQEKKTDAFKELVAETHSVSGTNTWTESFEYDGFGNISRINRNGANYGFQYDGLNRIQQENLPSGTNKYTYDDKGNRLTMETSTGVNIPDSTQDFTYNAVNELKTFNNNAGTSASYSYYGDGLRATKNVNGNLTRYVYLNGKVIEELDAGGNVKARNIWGNELLWRQDNTSGKSGYYFYNGHGDVVAIKDAAGNNINTYDYDIWGNLTSKTGIMDNPYRYTGEPQDDESGLIYLRARYYDPTVGRFISQDTVEGDLNNPLSLNLYTYVQNNPVFCFLRGGLKNRESAINWHEKPPSHSLKVVFRIQPI
ncbi:S8 family serine peptidase [Paenibacillus hamazuiensis]|uniref:S8 family serine peptidase n=1 Tax=Paenibacillus hamazuiensis TaxID=2936508 RepID=UPI00200CB9FE|nr:S8 family serine peptidase [Paenibacillus hamazuiensis]